MIPELITACMREQNLKLYDFAAYFAEGIPTKVRQHTIGYWLHGKYNPSVRILKEAIRAYPVTDPRGLLARQMAIAIDLPELAGELEPTPSTSVPAESQN
jgi:hypothetical protein